MFAGRGSINGWCITGDAASAALAGGAASRARCPPTTHGTGLLTSSKHGHLSVHKLPPPRLASRQTLIKRTKHGDEGDVDRRLAAGIMRSQRYKQADFDAG